MMDMAEQINAIIRLEPNSPALEFNHQWLTWHDISRLADSINKALERAGISAEEGVSILLRNRPAHYAALLAMLISKRCIVTINPMLPKNKVFSELKKLRTKAIIADQEDWEVEGAATLADEIGCVAISLNNMDAAKTLPGRDSLETGDYHKPCPNVAIYMLTSGTTGTPKRIPLYRDKLQKALTDAMAYDKSVNPEDPPKLRKGVSVQQNSYVHISGIFGALTTTLSGRQICMLERFDVDDWRDAIKRHQPVVASVVPTGLRMIMDANIPKEDLSSLVAFRSGTAPLPVELAESIFERYGVPVLGNYGATEFAGGVAGWSFKDWKLYGESKRGSVGRVNKGVEARIVDSETFEPLPVGSEGLLEVRGGQVTNDETWVRTTDLARMDDDCFIWILGRADNAIVRGGFKIMPGDVAKVLEQHPTIREVGVVGISDRRLGQVPVAAYILNSGCEAPTDSELIEWIKERMTAYSVPVMFLCVEELPRTPSLKISANGVQALFENKTVAAAEAS
jgi:long-chain acyl-CoA synthetase